MYVILSVVKLHFKTIMILYMILLFLTCAQSQSPPTICLEEGACYLGSWATTDQGTKFSSFQGIRYAQPPIGDLRFKSPQPYVAGEAIWDVSGQSDVQCPQISNDGVLSGEEGLRIIQPRNTQPGLDYLTPMIQPKLGIQPLEHQNDTGLNFYKGV